MKWPRVWNCCFDDLLLILVNNIFDSDKHIRIISLHVLVQFMRYKPERCTDHCELLIENTLKAHRDVVQEVRRAAKDCAMALVEIVDPAVAIQKVLHYIETDATDHRVYKAAVKITSNF